MCCVQPPLVLHLHTFTPSHHHTLTLSHYHRVYLRVLPDNNPMAFGIVLGTKLWLYITAMGYFYPAGTLTHYVWMHVALFVTMGVFYRLTKSDPGLIPRCKSLQEAHRVSVYVRICVFVCLLVLSIIFVAFRPSLNCVKEDNIPSQHFVQHAW